jgi:uncharacterized membrane protein
MASKASIAGHPVHPMLVAFPIGLLSTLLVSSKISLLRSHPKSNTSAENKGGCRSRRWVER